MFSRVVLERTLESVCTWLTKYHPEVWRGGLWEAIREAQVGAPRDSYLVVEVVKSGDGRVFANVSQDGTQLAHLKAGETWVERY